MSRSGAKMKARERQQASEQEEKFLPETIDEAIEAGLEDEAAGGNVVRRARPVASEGKDEGAREAKKDAADADAKEDGAGPDETEEDGAGEPDGAAETEDEGAEGGEPEGEDDADAAPEGGQETEDEADEAELPEELKGASKGALARFRELNKTLKARTAERDALRGQVEEIGKHVNGFREMLRGTGADAQEIAGTLEYLRLRKAAGAGDTEAMRQAFEISRRETQILARALGERTSDYDPIDEFDDLKAQRDDLATELSDQAISQQRYDRDIKVLEEAARARIQARSRTNAPAAGARAPAQPAAAAAAAAGAEGAGNAPPEFPPEVQEAMVAVDRLEKELRKQPDYKDRMKIMGEDIAERIGRRFDPAEWEAELQREWDRAGELLERSRPARGTRSPITGAGTSGGRGRRALPKTTMEAIELGLRGDGGD